MRPKEPSVPAEKPSGDVRRPRRGRRRFTAFIILLCLLLAGGGAYYGWRQHVLEMQRRAAEEQKRREEELARLERERRLQEIRNQFAAMIAEMQRLFDLGSYDEVRALAASARAFAAEHGLSADPIDRLLARMELKIGLARIAELEKMADDIFAYQYVRDGATALLDIPELVERCRALIEKTWRNEYLVCLHLAEKTLDEGAAGRSADLNYGFSKRFLARAIEVRRVHAVAYDLPRERTILRRQNTLFFAQETLTERSVPVNLY